MENPSHPSLILPEVSSVLAMAWALVSLVCGSKLQSQFVFGGSTIVEVIGNQILIVKLFRHVFSPNAFSSM